MSETKVVDIKVAEKVADKKKPFRSKIEVINPTMIVSVWDLLSQSHKAVKTTYPDTSEDQAEKIQAWTFEYLKSPSFFGLIAKAGKRPVGIIMGDVRFRPYGRPASYYFLSDLWVDPVFRKRGIGKALFEEASLALKKQGVFYWESHLSDDPSAQLALSKFAVKPIYLGLGGKLV